MMCHNAQCPNFYEREQVNILRKRGTDSTVFWGILQYYYNGVVWKIENRRDPELPHVPSIGREYW